MVTGEISMTDGNAYVNNHSVIKELDQVRQNIGYIDSPSFLLV